MNRVSTLAAVVISIVVSTTMSWPASAKPSEVGDDEIVRFTRTVSQMTGMPSVSVWLHRKPEASGWKIRLFDREAGETVGLKALPEWAGADYYSYDVGARRFGEVVVLLFEASPSPGVDSPPGADSFQVAWGYGVRRDGKRGWQQIASTRSSALDGGDRLVVRREGGAERLVRVRTSEETRFCGEDLSAYQVFNPQEMAFRSELDVDALEADAVEVDAQLPDWKYVPSPFPQFSLWYSATSDRFNVDDSRTVIRPLQLGDRDVGTAWMEGAPGTGRGQFVTARVNTGLKLRGLRILPGHAGSPDEYRAFGVPTRILISVEDGSAFVTDLRRLSYEETEKGGYIVQLPRPILTSCVSVVLLDGEEGVPAEDSQDAWKRSSIAISELTPLSELYGLAPDVAALVVVEKLLKEEDSRRSRRLVRLTSPLGDELVRVLESVLQGGSEEDRVRVIPLLRSLPSDASIPILIEMLEQTEPSDDAYTAVKPAISAHGDRAAGALVELLEKTPIEEERKYTDVTRLIGRLGRPEHLSELVRRLGHGSQHIRNERVRAISRGGATMLTPLFTVATEAIDAPSGEDALVAINAIGRKLYFRGQGTHEGSRVLLRLLDQGKRRRTRLLALKALGYFETEGAIAALTNCAEVFRDPLLRRQAVESLGRYPDRDARRVLEAALFDESPDVRISAISGLSERKDRRQALASIQRYVERETWDPGLEVGYTIMAELGDDNLLGEMESAIARDPSSSRAAIAAEALQRAGRPISASLASQLIYSPVTDVRMKRNLVDLLGLEGTPEGERLLVELIHASMPFPELQPRQNERLRQRAMLAVGRRDSPGGRRELLRLVDAGPSSDFKALALRGLSFSRERSLIPRLQLLKASAPSDLEQEFDRTIEMIERRAGIEELQQGIEESLEAGDGEKTRRPRPDEGPGPEER